MQAMLPAMRHCYFLFLCTAGCLSALESTNRVRAASWSADEAHAGKQTMMRNEHKPPQEGHDTVIMDASGHSVLLDDDSNAASLQMTEHAQTYVKDTKGKSPGNYIPSLSMVAVYIETPSGRIRRRRDTVPESFALEDTWDEEAVWILKDGGDCYDGDGNCVIITSGVLHQHQAENPSIVDNDGTVDYSHPIHPGMNPDVWLLEKVGNGHIKFRSQQGLYMVDANGVLELHDDCTADPSACEFKIVVKHVAWMSQYFLSHMHLGICLSPINHPEHHLTVSGSHLEYVDSPCGSLETFTMMQAINGTDSALHGGLAGASYFRAPGGSDFNYIVEHNESLKVHDYHSHHPVEPATWFFEKNDAPNTVFIKSGDGEYYFEDTRPSPLTIPTPAVDASTGEPYVNLMAADKYKANPNAFIVYLLNITFCYDCPPSHLAHR